MELRISLDTKEEIERFILIANLGLTAALKADAINIREAERHLYTPYSFTILEGLGIDEDVITLVRRGCELEDYESLIPHKLKYAIDRIHNDALKLLHIKPKPEKSSKKWIVQRRHLETMNSATGESYKPPNPACKNMATKHCCEMMTHYLNQKCDIHDNPFDCPDNIMFYDARLDEYGIIIHDGGRSYVTIRRCPFCGKVLPESKIDLWLEELEVLGIKRPFEDEIPEEYKTDAWWKMREDNQKK